jgi:amidohydrolase
VDAALGMHVTPDLPPGKAACKPGIAMSSVDVFRVLVQGRGGHSSQPHLCIDPLRIVNAIYLALSTLTAREVDPFEPAVLSIGKCGGGTAANIIPDTATLEGTFRCFSPEVGQRVVPRIHATIETITASMGGRCTLEKTHTPAVYNDPGLCGALMPFIEEVIGRESLAIAERPIPATDDFAFLSARVPSVFLQLGAGGLAPFPLHNPNVLLEEDTLPVGSALLANCAIRWLGLAD